MATLARTAARLLKFLVMSLVGTVVLISVGWGLMARGLPDLRPWHRIAPTSEMSAGELGPATTLAEYLAREDALMREVVEKVEGWSTPDRLDLFQRYAPGGRVNPSTFTTNWNRTLEMQAAAVRGGALLIHGMTDSPYSMRAIARCMSDAGYHTLALRMPGHGTVPAGLARARWQDWAAAVRLGARHFLSLIGDGQPFVIVGYSNGGALAVNYALDTLDDASLPRPDRLVLVSPMIGVTALAGLSNLISLLDRVPYFEKGAWTSVQPEYNPFKYNSFPTAAGQESYRLTSQLERKIEEAANQGTLSRLPPMLTFQSIVDSTVLTGAIVHRLYDRLPANGNELVMFDLDRRSEARAFMLPVVDSLFKTLIAGTARNYRISVVSNLAPDTSEVAEWDISPGATQPVTRALSLHWPAGVYSLSHIALPFPVNDPLYGLEPDQQENFGIRLGRLQPRGERGVLIVTSDDLLRLSSNPFFPYLEARLREWVAVR